MKNQLTSLALGFALTACNASTGTSTPSDSSNTTASTETPSGHYLYASDETDDLIYEYQINTDGSLTAIAGNESIGTLSQPMSIAVSPVANFLYVTNQNSTEITYYSIDSENGALTYAGDYSIGSGFGYIGVFNTDGASEETVWVGKVVDNQEYVTQLILNNTTGAITLGDGPLTPSSQETGIFDRQSVSLTLSDTIFTYSISSYVGGIMLMSNRTGEFGSVQINSLISIAVK